MKEERIYHCLFCGASVRVSGISWYKARSLEGCCKVCMRSIPDVEYWQCMEMMGEKVPDMIKRKYPDDFRE